MNEIHRDLPAKDFEFSDEIESHYYCAGSGLLAGSGCPVGGLGWYKSDAVPARCSSSGCYRYGAPSDSEDTENNGEEEGGAESGDTPPATDTPPAADTPPVVDTPPVADTPPADTPEG